MMNRFFATLFQAVEHVTVLHGLFPTLTLNFDSDDGEPLLYLHPRANK